MLQVYITVVLSGIEISGLAIGPKVRGRVRWIFKSDESPQHIFLRWESKAVLRFYGMLKAPA
jgi:hypothetical protein